MHAELLRAAASPSFSSCCSCWERVLCMQAYRKFKRDFPEGPPPQPTVHCPEPQAVRCILGHILEQVIPALGAVAFVALQHLASLA